MARSRLTSGFTLIELSIVLVIIGLIVGGVLVGRDLITAAAVRAQISQIEKFNTAVNTFKGKYGELPGDMSAASAARLGFTTRSGIRGYGDGDGIIESWAWGGLGPSGLGQGYGEKALFWIDLTTANDKNVNLVPGSFTLINTGADISDPTIIARYFPAAQIGNSAHISVLSWNGVNYFNLSRIYFMSGPGTSSASAALSVKQAYAMDSKLDDGLPQSGKLTARYEADSCCEGSFATPKYPTWAAGNADRWGPYGAYPGASAAASTTTCYDNAGNASNPMQYSITYNNGTGVNCALLFSFQ